MNDYGKTVTRDTLSRLHTSIKECIKTAQADKVFIDDFTFLLNYSLQKSLNLLKTNIYS